MKKMTRKPNLQYKGIIVLEGLVLQLSSLNTDSKRYYRQPSLRKEFYTKKQDVITKFWKMDEIKLCKF